MMVLAPSVAKDNAPKNEKVDKIILLIGDGMGLGVSSAWMVDRNYEPTCFDRAQFVGISKTYSLNSRVTDSAAGGTALAVGHKTNNTMLGMLPDGTKLESIAEAAKKEGKSVGLLVTSDLLDATPAAFYAHTESRSNFRQIEEDLIAFVPDVILGGGRQRFTSEKWEDGTMLDKAEAAGMKVYETPEAFYSLTSLDAPVLGLFDEGSYPMVIDRDSDFLADCLKHTLDLLGDNKKGFFIMAEGSHIDHAAHANNTEQMLFEMEEFDKAVNAAMDYADTHKGTLVIVTADHDTGGASLVSANKDFHLGDSGIGVKYTTTGHTGTPVIIYAYGASAWKFSGVMENAELNQKMREVLLKGKK
ncbi:MAG: alkaline phosphatase [Candidatus Cryptobacteroides sp.]